MKVAVAVSGGLDSYIAYRMASRSYEAVPFYVDGKHPYAEKEKEVVIKLIPETIFIDADLAVEKLHNVPSLYKPEIFGRNLLIAFYGALLAEEVWIAALSTEMNHTAVKDKQPEFFQLTSGLLTFLLKNKRNKTEIKTPFANSTKTDIIFDAIAEGTVTAEELKNTVSCYSNNEHHCGVCPTCFKRWVAMENNNIKEDYVESPYQNNLYGLEIRKLIVNEIMTKKFSGRFSYARIKETLSALYKVNTFMKRDFEYLMSIVDANKNLDILT